MDVGVKPIIEKFLLPNYLCALEFKEGWVFARVVRRRICQYKPWPLIDSAGNAVDIAASSHQSELRFRDPRNPSNDILYLDTTTNSGYPWIMHGSFGIAPKYVYMYVRFPEGGDIPGKFPNIDPIKPASGDNVGYINGEVSPYEQPTDFVEIVIPPTKRVAAEYYNKDGERSHRPVLNILFAVYWLQILDPDVHGELIRKIAARQVPAAFLTVGFGDTPVEIGGTIQSDWRAKPLSLDEALEV